jgi:hypothetical protein
MKRRAAFRLAVIAAVVTWFLALVAPGALPAAEGPAGDSASAAQVQAPAGAEKQVCQTFRVREQDQVWLVSTRHLDCCVGKFLPSFQIWLYEKGTWQPRTEADFFAADSAEVVTPIYIHGNRITASEASSYGLSFYFELAGKFDHEPPVRFVIWSWPSDQIRGPLKDVRVKADRSDCESYFLAYFLSKMKPEVRVGLLGYSFGARVLSGALHVVHGGAMFGYVVPGGGHPRIRAALWAAAEHNHWYQPGQFHGRAPAPEEPWFVTVNPCDPVLSRYRFIDECSNPVAVGYAGIYGRNLIDPVANAGIEEVNVSNIVGGTHDWRLYLYSPWIQNRTRDYVLWHDLGVTKVAGSQVTETAKTTSESAATR